MFGTNTAHQRQSTCLGAGLRALFLQTQVDVCVTSMENAPFPSSWVAAVVPNSRRLNLVTVLTAGPALADSRFTKNEAAVFDVPHNGRAVLKRTANASLLRAEHDIFWIRDCVSLVSHCRQEISLPAQFN
jgi:hypothetical protein